MVRTERIFPIGDSAGRSSRGLSRFFSRKIATPMGKNPRGSLIRDIALLYRANFQSRALEEAMLRYNIPYQVLGVKFLKEKKSKILWHICARL